jgi:hypothetical protein
MNHNETLTYHLIYKFNNHVSIKFKFTTATVTSVEIPNMIGHCVHRRGYYCNSSFNALIGDEAQLRDLLHVNRLYCEIATTN